MQTSSHDGQSYTRLDAKDLKSPEARAAAAKLMSDNNHVITIGSYAMHRDPVTKRCFLIVDGQRVEYKADQVWPEKLIGTIAVLIRPDRVFAELAIHVYEPPAVSA